MGKISKTFALILIGVIVISFVSILTVKPADAQLIPKPTIPQFTVNWENTSPDNESIVIIITNQKFTSFIDNTSGTPWNISLFYDIREKAHDEENWTDIYYPTGPIESSSQYTVITEQIRHYSNVPCDDLILGSTSVQVAAGSQLDFQVEAVIGYAHRVIDFPRGNPWVFNGTESGWSETQTVTIPTGSSAHSPSPTVPEFSRLVTLPLLLSVFFVAVVLRYRKTAYLSK